MKQERTSHILNAASNLLGIALVIIAGLNVSHAAQDSKADEIAWAAAICFATSCCLSYLALRGDTERSGRAEQWADRIFLLGLLALVCSIIVLAMKSG